MISGAAEIFSTSFDFFQLQSESILNGEVSRLKEKIQGLEDLLESKNEFLNEHLRQFAEVKKQRDTLDLSNKDSNEVGCRQLQVT